MTDEEVTLSRKVVDLIVKKKKQNKKKKKNNTQLGRAKMESQVGQSNLYREPFPIVCLFFGQMETGLMGIVREG